MIWRLVLKFLTDIDNEINPSVLKHVYIDWESTYHAIDLGHF